MFIFAVYIGIYDINSFVVVFVTCLVRFSHSQVK